MIAIEHKEMNKKVCVCVSGKIFESTIGTLSKIPYFGLGFEMLGNESVELINLDRSARAFKHVLAYVQDDAYPFPAEYEYELKFLDIVYNPEHMVRADAKTHLLINQLREEVASLRKEVEVTKTIAHTICQATHYRNYQCLKCEDAAEDFRLTCKSCRPLCVALNCQAKTEVNYCSIHVSIGNRCNVKGCWHYRIKGNKYCVSHL
jgi:hypothetical protein